jgi:putative transposase
MKRTKFSEQQIAFILRQVEEGAAAVGEVWRKAGISDATCYNWRKKYGGLMPSEMKQLKQLKQLEDENPAAEEAGCRSQPRGGAGGSIALPRHRRRRDARPHRS